MTTTTSLMTMMSLIDDGDSTVPKRGSTRHTGRKAGSRNINWAVECEMPSGQCSLAEIKLGMLGHGNLNGRRVRYKQIRKQPALYYHEWRVARAFGWR